MTGGCRERRVFRRFSGGFGIQLPQGILGGLRPLFGGPGIPEAGLFHVPLDPLSGHIEVRQIELSPEKPLLRRRFEPSRRLLVTLRDPGSLQILIAEIELGGRKTLGRRTDQPFQGHCGIIRPLPLHSLQMEKTDQKLRLGITVFCQREPMLQSRFPLPPLIGPHTLFHRIGQQQRGVEKQHPGQEDMHSVLPCRVDHQESIPVFVTQLSHIVESCHANKSISPMVIQTHGPMGTRF